MHPAHRNKGSTPNSTFSITNNQRIINEHYLPDQSLILSQRALARRQFYPLTTHRRVMACGFLRCGNF